MYTPPTALFERLSPLLQTELSTSDSSLLCAQLTQLEAVRFELSATRTKGLSKLLQERERLRIPKDKEYTELDRKVMLEANTAIIEADYQWLQALEVIVTERLSLGIAILQTL